MLTEHLRTVGGADCTQVAGLRPIRASHAVRPRVENHRKSRAFAAIVEAATGAAGNAATSSLVCRAAGVDRRERVRGQAQGCSPRMRADIRGNRL